MGLLSLVFKYAVSVAVGVYVFVRFFSCGMTGCTVVCLQAGGSSGLLMDLAANEKAVHSDFFNGKGQVSATLPKLLNLMRIKFTSLIQFNEVRAYTVELELNINLVFIWHG